MGVTMAVAGIGGLLMQYGPGLVRHLFGPRAAEVMEAGKAAIEQVTGTADPNAAANALALAQVESDLRLELARLAAEADKEERDYELAMFTKAVDERMAALSADVNNTINARQMTQSLIASGSKLAWGSAVVTGVLLMLFAYVIVSGHDLAADMRETVKNLVIMAASYWIGSSRGSAAKDERGPTYNPPSTAIATTGDVITQRGTPVGTQQDEDDPSRSNRRRR